MGRKGVSKRKPVQTKSKLLSGGDGSGTVSSLMKSAVSQPVKLNDMDKSMSPQKNAPGGKKSNRKH